MVSVPDFYNLIYKSWNLVVVGSSPTRSFSLSCPRVLHTLAFFAILTIVVDRFRNSSDCLVVYTIFFSIDGNLFLDHDQRTQGAQKRIELCPMNEYFSLDVFISN